MILTLLHWSVSLLILYPLGLAVVHLLRREDTQAYPTERFALTMMSGLFALALLAGIFHFLLPMDSTFTISAGILSLSLLTIPALRRQALADMSHLFQGWRLPAWLLFGATAWISLMKAVTPGEVLDEQGYHLPLIRWFEDFRLVPGIANIEDRFGFNMTKYLLDASLSLRDVHPDGLYGLNALLHIVLVAAFIDGLQRLLRGHRESVFSDGICAVSLLFSWKYPLSSMDADFLNLYGTLFLIISMVRALETGKQGLLPLHAILWVFLVTNKFSAVLLLPIFLATYGRNLLPGLLQKRVSIPSAVFLAVWMLRNLWISGYLVYPFVFTDLIPVDWKVSERTTLGQYYYVEDYAKREQEVPYTHYPQTAPDKLDLHWVKDWWRFCLPFFPGRFAVFGSGYALLALLFVQVNARRRLPTRLPAFLDALLLFLVIWFFTIPSLRFGWFAFMGIIGMGMAAIHLWSERIFRFVLIACTLLIGGSQTRNVWQATRLAGDKAEVFLRPPIRFAPAEVCEEQWGNFVVRRSSIYFCGGCAPPCLPDGCPEGLQPRGSRVEDGFRDRTGGQANGLE